MACVVALQVACLRGSGVLAILVAPGARHARFERRASGLQTHSVKADGKVEVNAAGQSAGPLAKGWREIRRDRPLLVWDDQDAWVWLQPEGTEDGHLLLVG